jgi:arylsulfatase A-like enzyme
MDQIKMKPNILIILVDEQRFPPPYEDNSIREWRAKNLKAQEFLLKNGIEFKNHHAASTACAPSRTSLYTGQYPSLHGVSQTDGAAKTAFDPGMFWLDPNTVPTLGDYLRASGYDTFWKGKWHASFADITVPDTHDSYPTYENLTGIPIPENQRLYSNANRLNNYGFNGWIGPEPHGTNPHNSGASAAIGLSGRDQIYASEVIKLLNQLQQRVVEGAHEQKPWAIAASFVNPHDIALFGEITRLLPMFNFEINSSVPPVPPAPTASENLDTKPIAQASYRTTYPKALQPLKDSETYRRLYYSLQLTVDQEIDKVLEALRQSDFYKNTIIVYASDHGDLLGAHGGLFQKWYQAYEEAIHVPLIIHNPKLIPKSKSVDMLTSHVDILPTILGLVGIDESSTLEELKKYYTEPHPLVGRDLTPLIMGDDTFRGENEPIYFMTDDDVTRGLNQISALGKPYKSVIQPNHIETVMAQLPTGDNNRKETWKYSRYFDNPQFWINPGCDNTNTAMSDSQGSTCDTLQENDCAADEFEMYNLTKDPIESRNLANREFETVQSSTIRVVLAKLLAEQCKTKRLYPTSGDVPGKPSCKNCTPSFGI